MTASRSGRNSSSSIADRGEEEERKERDRQRLFQRGPGPCDRPAVRHAASLHRRCRSPVQVRPVVPIPT